MRKRYERLSNIDMGNMPVIVTPNEYRDGIIRSMQ